MAVARPPGGEAISAPDTIPAVDYMHSHPNCRCAMVPVLKSWTEMGFPSVDALLASGELDQEPPSEPGEELLRQLPVSTQKRILGRGRWNLWRHAKNRPGIPDGWGLGLQQMLTDHHSPDWGNQYRLRTINDILADLSRMGGVDAVNARRVEQEVFPWRFREGARYDFYANPTPVNKANRDARLSDLGLGPDRSRQVADGLAAITAPDRAEIRVRVPRRVLPAIIQDGRLKSQFETDTSQGVLDQEIRRHEEEALFGYPLDLDPADRPIYGYLGPTDGNPESVTPDQYGDVVIRLKQGVRARATFTTRDSLFSEVIPTPLEQPGPEAATSDVIYDRMPEHVSDVAQYMEAQVHGGVVLSDISEVVFVLDPWAPPSMQRPPSPDVIAMLDEAVIPHRVVVIDRPETGVYDLASPGVVIKPHSEELREDVEEYWTPELGVRAMDVPYVDRGRIKARRDAVVANHLAARQWGEVHGITQPEYLRRLDEAVAAALNPGRVEARVRVPVNVVVDIVSEGRIKSQFETGESQAVLDPDLRAKVEATTFGYPTDDTPADQRPISVYVSEVAKEPSPDVVEQYGGVVIRLKNTVRSRMTILSSDSLAPGEVADAVAEHTPVPIEQADHAVVSVLNYPARRETVPAEEGEGGAFQTEDFDDTTGELVTVWRKAVRTPFTEPEYRTYVANLIRSEQEYPGAKDHLTALTRDGIAHERYAYWEGQVHGTLPTTDIAEVVFTGEMQADEKGWAMDALDAAGIPYRDTRAKPGERGYVEGLDDSNWMTHPSHRRVGAVAPSVLSAPDQEADIEPAAVREEVEVYAEPETVVFPPVGTPESFLPVGPEPGIFTSIDEVGGTYVATPFVAIEPGTFTEPFSPLGLNPADLTREVVAVLGHDPASGLTPSWTWANMVNPDFVRIERRHIGKIMSLYQQSRALEAAQMKQFDQDRQMALLQINEIIRKAILALYDEEWFPNVVGQIVLRNPDLVTRITNRHTALDVISALSAYTSTTLKQAIETDTGIIVDDQIRTIARMLGVDISDLVYNGLLDTGVALVRLRDRWANRLDDRFAEGENVEEAPLPLHFPAPTLDAATQRRPREDLREALREALRERIRNMTWVGMPGTSDREALFDSKAEALRRIMSPTRLDFRIRAPVHLIDDIIEDGALRTQFDPANDQPPKDQHDFRAAIEEAYYGIPADAHFTERPVYGYLSSPEAEPGFEALDYYGTAIIRLKPERVAHRTTFVVGDSVMDASARSADAYTDGLPGTTFETAVGDRWHINPGTIPSAVTDPQIESVGEHFDERGFLSTLYDLSDDSYVEAQYHAGVTLDDIAEVVFVDDGSGFGDADLARARAALDRVGIPHRTVSKYDQRLIVTEEEQAARKAADPTWLTRDDLPALFGLPMSERRARWAQVPVDLRDALANAPTEIDERVKALVGPYYVVGMPDADIAKRFVDTYVEQAPEATRETLKSLLYGVIDNMVEHALAQYRPQPVADFTSTPHTRTISTSPTSATTIYSRLVSPSEAREFQRTVWITPSEEQRAPWIARLDDPEQGWATYVPDVPGVQAVPGREGTIFSVYVMTKEGPGSRIDRVTITIDRKGVQQVNVASDSTTATTEDMSRSAARAVVALGNSTVIDTLMATLTPSEHAAFGRALMDFSLKASQTEAMAVEAAWGDITPIVTELTRLAVAQEIETARRVLGDHGARHLEGNARMASDILRVVPGHDTAADFAMMYVAAVLHDAGYLTTLARNFLDGDHPRHSRQYLEQSALASSLAKVFGKAWVDRLAHVIGTHADTEMDWVNDPQGSAFRVADNLALFQKEKLPALFHLVPENTPLLVRLARKEITAGQAMTAMTANVNRAYDERRIDAKTAHNLLAAIDEVSDLLPKFTLGMLGGEVDGFQWSDDHLTVNLTMRPANEEIAAMLDMNQRQFEKFAEAYGQDASGFVQKGMFEFRKDGQVLLAATIKRDPIPALREDVVYYGTPEPAIEALLPAAPPTGPPAAGVRQADEGEVRAKALLDANGVIYDGPGTTVSAWTLRAVMGSYTLPGRAKPGSIVTSPEGALGKYNERGVLTSILWKSDSGMINVRRVAYGREADQFETDTPYQVAVELIAAANLKMKAPMPPGIHFAPPEDSPERRLWAEAIEIRAVLAEILGVKAEDSTWTGEFTILAEGARGYMNSSQGNMGVRADWAKRTIRERIEFLTHELLHSFSPAFPRGSYREQPGWEEGPTEALANYLAPVVMEQLGYAAPDYVREGYNEYVDPLHRIGQLLGYAHSAPAGDPTNMSEFLKAIFARPMNERQAAIVEMAEEQWGEDSAKWGVLFQNIRALNIDNPLDWGGKTSRDRLTDRALDVESLFAVSEELRARFKIRAPELATWQGWYGPLVRMTTPQEIGTFFREMLDELREAGLFDTSDEGEREAWNRLFRSLSGGHAGVFVGPEGRGVFFEELTPDRDEVLDEDGVTEAITRFQQLVAERPDDAVIPIVVSQNEYSASIVFRVMPTGGVPAYVRVEYRKETDSITSARIGWQIEPSEGDRRQVLDWLRSAAHIDARFATRPDVVVIDTRAPERVPDISRWSRVDVTPDEIQQGFERDFSEEERSVLGQIVVQRAQRSTSVVWRTVLGEAVIYATYESGGVAVMVREGIDPDYITTHLVDVANALHAEVAGPLELSTRGEAVEMGLTPQEQNARDPGMMDALVPEADDWLVVEDEDGHPSPPEANARAARRGLTPRRPYAWRTPTILDGAIFYTDGSVKALVSLVWPTASETPRIDVTPVFGNVVQYGDLVNERRALVEFLERQPQYGGAPVTVETTYELTESQANALLARLLQESGDQPTANTSALVRAIVRADNKNAYPIRITLPAAGNAPIGPPAVVASPPFWRLDGQQSVFSLTQTADQWGVPAAFIPPPGQYVSSFVEKTDPITNRRLWNGTLIDDRGVYLLIEAREQPEGWVAPDGRTMNITFWKRDVASFAPLTEAQEKMAQDFTDWLASRTVMAPARPIRPQDIIENTAEGYMGPQPRLTVENLGMLESEDGIHRVDQAPDVRLPAIVYNYVEGGRVVGMYMWPTGLGGYVDVNVTPQMILGRDLTRERQIEVATLLRQAMFADGHVHQPGQPPFIRTPPLTDAVELFVATHIGTLIADAKAEGVAEQGTPDTFEVGATGTLYLRDAEGGLIGRLVIGRDLSGQPTDGTVLVAPHANGRTEVDAISKRLQREAERRGWTWRWSDTAEGRAARAAETLRLTVENPRFEDMALPEYIIPVEVGFPKRPYPIAFDRSEWLTTTPDGARVRVYRTSVVSGVPTWGAVFSHDTSPDDRRDAIEAVAAAFEESELVRMSHPLPAVFTLNGERPAAMTAELAATLPEGFVATKTAEGTQYSLRDERGAIEFTVTNAGPMVSRFDANRKWSVYAATGDAWGLFIDLVQGIAADRSHNYPSWTVVADEMNLSDRLRTHVQQFLGPRQWHRRIVEDVLATVGAIDMATLVDLHIYRETPGWIGAQVTAEELAGALVFGEDSDFRYLAIRRPGIWTGVMVRVSDGSVVAIAQTSVSQATGNARTDGLDVYVPEFAHVEPAANARIVEKLARFAERARPPVMGPLERQMSGVTFEPRDSTLTHALIDIRAKQHEEAIAALNASARGVDQEFRSTVYLATVAGQTHTFVFTRADRTVIGVFQTDNPTYYDPTGVLYAAKDATDDELLAAFAEMRTVTREAPIISRLVENAIALPQPDAPAEDFGVATMRAFPLDGPKNGSLFSDIEGRPQWMLYDAEGRAHTIVMGTQDGVSLAVHSREPYGPLPDFEARWAEAYAQHPARVNADEISNDRWLNPLRDGSPDQGVIDPDWLDAFVDPPPDSAPAGTHVYGAMNGTGIVYQTNSAEDVEAVLVVPLRNGQPIPGHLGVVFAWDGDEYVRHEGAFGYVDTEGLRLKAVEAGYIDPETARWQNGMTDPNRVVNPVLYAEVTDDESLQWTDRSLRQRRQEWANWYGSMPSDVPDSFINLDLDTDFNGTMVSSVASNVGNEVLSGDPDTFRFVSWEDGGYGYDNEGAVIYYGPTGAAVSVVWFALDENGEVESVHWTKTHTSYRRQGLSTRVYEYAVTIGLNIEKESGLHGLTGIGTQYRNARIAQPRSRVILNVSRMRPELGEIATLDDVRAMRDNEVISEAEKRLPAELEANSVELIPDSAPETYEMGPGNKKPLNKTTPVIGRFEDGAEPSLRVEMDPSRVTAADVDFAAAYAVRRNDQDAVVVTIVGAAMKRLAGDNPNGFLLRVEGISTTRMQEVYDAVAKLTPNASIDDRRGVIEFSVITTEGDITPDMKAAWADLADQFGARFSVIPAHIRWVWYDEATKQAAEQSWFTFPGAVSLTADDVKKSLTEAKDGRAAKVRDARDRAAPAADDAGTKGRTGRPVRRRPRSREGVAPAADGTRRRRRPPGEPGESPDARPTRRRYRAPADGRLTAAVPATADLQRTRVEAEAIVRSIAERFGLPNKAWSGEVREATTTEDGPAFLDWDGALVVNDEFWSLNEEGRRMVLAHEMMHAISPMSEAAFRQFSMHEEGVAEGLARIWRRENNVTSIDAYGDAVQALEGLRAMLGMPEETFYTALARTPIEERAALLLEWGRARPTFPDRVLTDAMVNAAVTMRDWREAAILMTAWMYPHFTDPLAVVELLRRVEQQGNVGPARMRQFRESLLAASPLEWAERIERFAAGVGVNTALWLDLSVDLNFPYSTASVRRFDPMAMTALDIALRLGWEAIEYMINRAGGDYRVGDLEVSIPPLSPRLPPPRRLPGRKRAGPGVLAVQRTEGGGGEEEPVTRMRRYGPMTVPAWEV